MNLERAEKYRRPHPTGLPHRAGDPYGWFEIPTSIGGPVLRVLFSDASDWEHASVSLPMRCPTWDEMTKVKELLWDDHEAVVQYHPPKSVYVNFMPYCLHLWRPTAAVLPTPPTWMIGPRSNNE